MATLTAVPTTKISGGSFLIEERGPDDVFTPEDFTEQHLLIAQTTEEFANKEIVPNIERMEHKEFAVNRELVKKAGELGLSGVDVPEEYGGMEMDKVTSAIIADRLAKYGGFSTTLGRSHLHRHTAHRLFRHGRAEEEVSARAWQAATRWAPMPFPNPPRGPMLSIAAPGPAFPQTASTTS